MFHLAYPCSNLEKTKAFYVDILKAKVGRTGTNWMDFNFRWNQITITEMNNFKPSRIEFHSDGTPIRHFGIIMVLTDWKKILEELYKTKVEFLIEPRIVFPGEVGEQHSFFIADPDGYPIEFKGFKELPNVFKS